MDRARKVGLGTFTKQPTELMFDKGVKRRGENQKMWSNKKNQVGFDVVGQYHMPNEITNYTLQVEYFFGQCE